MLRQPRLDRPGALHHIMGRGIDGIEIFGSKKDCQDFLGRLQDLCENESLSIYAWALMDSHFHLLARTGKIPLSNSMRKLLTGSDERISGRSDFVKNVIRDAEEKEKETLRLNSKIYGLEILADQICDGEGVEKIELCSGIRKGNMVKCRKMFCQIAVKKMGYSGADVARFLGITILGVNRLSASDVLSDTEKYR